MNALHHPRVLALRTSSCGTSLHRLRGFAALFAIVAACGSDDTGSIGTSGSGGVAGGSAGSGGSGDASGSAGTGGASGSASSGSGGSGPGGDASGSGGTAGDGSGGSSSGSGGTGGAGGSGGSASPGTGGTAGQGDDAGVRERDGSSNPTDAATPRTDGSSGGSTLGCAGKSYKLCEDFESGSTGALPTGWTKYKGYGAGAATDVMLANDQFHSGKLALKSSSMVTGQTRAQHSLSSLGATASKHWGRVYYKVQSPATKPSSGVLHVTFVGLFGSQENRVVDIVEDTKGAHQWLYNNPDDKGSSFSDYSWTFDSGWHCAEWYIDVSTKSYRFFSDSKEVPKMAFTNKTDSEMSNYNAIIVGSTFYQAPPSPFVMWFDDLAIDDNQIGCL